MEKPKFRQYIKYILLNIVLAALISMFLVNYVASAFRIEGESMHSSLKHQERVIMSKTGITANSLKRFDIIILKKPDDPRKKIIKRIIALPGEVLDSRSGALYIDSQKIDQPFLANHLDPGDLSPSKFPITLKKGCFFVLGDNRVSSLDSRHFGPVHMKNILGKAIFRYWPLARLGLIK